MVYLYITNISLANVDAKYNAMLSSYRKKKLERLVNPNLTAQHYTAELLMCHALYEVFGLNFPHNIVTNSGGKPRLAGGEACFSISHSGKMCLAAVSNSEIGADIQQKVKDIKIYKKILSPTEIHEFNQLHEDTAQKKYLTEKFSIKESILKLTGEGLGGGLSRICTKNNNTWETQGFWQGEEYFVSFASFSKSSGYTVKFIDKFN